jgi:hypothetical protein
MFLILVRPYKGGVLRQNIRMTAPEISTQPWDNTSQGSATVWYGNHSAIKNLLLFRFGIWYQ